VVIPPQEITDQPLTVQVVEPKLGSVTIEGNRFFGDKNIRRFFEGKITTPEGMLVAEKLEKQMDLANRHPDRQIAAVLKPGDEPGVSDVTLNVTERKALHTVTPLHLAVAASTVGTPNVGRVWMSNTLQYTNLFDRDHGVSLNWQLRPSDFDSAQIFGGSYVVPIGTTGHMLAVYGGYSDTETDAVVDTLQVTGKGYTVGAQFAYELPEFSETKSKASVGVEYSHLNSTLEFGTFTVIESDVGLLPIYARYDLQRRDPYGTSLGYLAVRWNPGGIASDGETDDFAEFREEAKASFVTYKLGLERYQKLLAGWSLDARFDAQYTIDNLIPGEQFRLGGMDSVRGFEQSEISGDKGFKIRTELRTPNLPALFSRFIKKEEVLQAVAFLDYGLARLHDPIEGDPKETDGAGAGFGLRYQFTEYFMGRVDFAWALTDAATTQSGDSTVYFTAQLNF
jgi:hemolysin activation/secretion protein